MAYYNNGNYFDQVNNGIFQQLNAPGSATPYSGIYRCEGCGHEITSIHQHTLPPQKSSSTYSRPREHPMEAYSWGQTQLTTI